MKIKQIPEDFVVEESLKLGITKEKAPYSIIKLTKKSWDAFRIVEELARKLKTKTKFIGFAGNKDKKAVTTQYFSLYKIPKEKIEKIEIKDVTISFVGYSNNRINLGDLEGNNFKITIRGINKLKLPKSLQLENYFDEQRFGNKLNTHLIGKAIIKRDFKKACELLGLKDNGDYVGALKKQPKRLLRFYIAAYQSYLWNKNLSKILSKQKNVIKIEYKLGELIFLKNKIKNFKLPLMNFDVELNKGLKQILREEGVKREDFIIREMPELITESQNRDAFINIKNIKYLWKKDRLELSFFLQKGSYATMLIKKLTKAF